MVIYYEEFEYPTTWGGYPITKKEREISFNKLKPFDIVRVCLKTTDHPDSFYKVYVVITRTERYKYGGIYKMKKIYGYPIKIYYDDCEYLDQFGIDFYDCMSFQPKNIIEIPGWIYDNRFYDRETHPNLMKRLKKPKKDHILDEIYKKEKYANAFDYEHKWKRFEKEVRKVMKALNTSRTHTYKLIRKVYGSVYPMTNLSISLLKKEEEKLLEEEYQNNIPKAIKV